MSKSTTLTPDDISESQFRKALAQYPDLIKAVSDSKGNKSGQKSLAELDAYRYEEAPRRFGINADAIPMTLDDVKILVEWKLRHGKFRPTLMKLVTANDPSAAAETITAATASYKTTHSAPAAVDALTKLKGIGPATASLLLAVLDPQRVPFFADEVFWWLCCDARKDAAIKYTAKEYKTLLETAGALMGRLGVEASEVERVAYVLMNQGGDGEGEDGLPEKTELLKAKQEIKPHAVEKPEKPERLVTNSAKRRPPASEAAVNGAPLRRSKRGKEA